MGWANRLWASVAGAIDRIGIRIAAFARWFWFGHAGARTPWVRRVLGTLFAFLVPIPILLILLFRFVPIPFTPQMGIDLITLNPVKYSWREDWEISPFLGRAVIGSEDQNFCQHNGFDWKAIDKAIKKHERHPTRTLHGASTISQQAARTIFLTPARSWVRKGVEAYLTVLLEGLWPKKRILTAYLNLVDWGHGNFGAEAASEVYFGKPAAALNRSEAARLAAILPNPSGWDAAKPGPYVQRRSGAILTRMFQVTRDHLDSCIKD